MKSIHIFTVLLLALSIPSIALIHDQTPEVKVALNGSIGPINASHTSYNVSTCAPWDLGCWIVKAFEALWSALVSGARSVIDSVLIKPLLKFGVALPVYNTSLISIVNSTYFLSAMLSNAMNRVYEYTVVAAYGVLGGALVLSGLWILGESMDIVRQGEGMATLKRFLLAAILIPVSRYLYDLAALGIALINSTILNIDAFRSYAVAAVGALITVSVGLGLLGGWALLAGLLLVALFLLVLGAMRFLLIAVLAVLLPVAIALAVFPLSFIRNVGTTLISMLINLMMATVVCSAIFALGSAMGFSLENSPAENAMKLIIFFACLLAPALSLVIAPRASIGLYAASMFLGYAFRPWVSRLAQQLYPQLRHGVAALERAPYIGRVVRVGTTLYRISRQPGGVPSYAASRIVRVYRAWRASVEHLEESSDSA